MPRKYIPVDRTKSHLKHVEAGRKGAEATKRKWEEYKLLKEYHSQYETDATEGC